MLQIVRVEQVIWRDSSLGCPEPGMLYLMALTPGILLTLSYQGQKFGYRVDDTLGGAKVALVRHLPKCSLLGAW